MGSALKIIQIALALVPYIIETVKAVEVSGNGPAKKDAVIAIVSAGIDSFAPELGVSSDKVQGFISKVIDLVVGLLNKVGVFKKA